MADIAAAKRLIALSPEGARLLGAGVYRQCAQCRIDSAAQVALADGTTNYTEQERRVIAEAIGNEDDDQQPAQTLNLRVAAGTKEALSRLAGDLGVVAVQGRYAGEPSISQLVDMVAAGELQVVRKDKDNEGDNI